MTAPSLAVFAASPTSRAAFPIAVRSPLSTAAVSEAAAAATCCSPAATASEASATTAGLFSATVLATAASVAHLNFGTSGFTPASTSAMIASPSQAATQSSLFTMGGRAALSGVGAGAPRCSEAVGTAAGSDGSAAVFRAALVLGLMERSVRYRGRFVKQNVRYSGRTRRSIRPNACRGAPSQAASA